MHLHTGDTQSRFFVKFILIVLTEKAPSQTAEVDFSESKALNLGGS
jgi:hypothetical protein